MEILARNNLTRYLEHFIDDHVDKVLYLKLHKHLPVKFSLQRHFTVMDI